MFGNYDFGAPVNPLQAVMVDLTKPSEAATPVVQSVSQGDATPAGVIKEPKNTASWPSFKEESRSEQPAVQKPRQVEPDQAQAAGITENKSETSTPPDDPLPNPELQIASGSEIVPPLRTAAEFLATKNEKLIYQINLLGVPVGSAELEANNDKGEVRITLRVKSNAAMTDVYPVNDFIETRHIAGNFVITKIKQQEGDFRSDIGFTIFLRDKKVFWFDRIRNRYSRETIPNSEVLDTLSGFYFLRNKALQIGRTETLHIYNGDDYALVPVEVLRRDMIRLPNLKKIDTLVVHPVRKSGGTFRSTGDTLIWLTNDENRVPVRVETTTALGKVTAELLSAESQRQE